jgi:flagellar biogenesis protein FliO
MKKNHGKHKHNKNQENEVQSIVPEKEQPIQPDISRAKVLLFWSIILLLIFLSWALPKLFNTHEYTIERWLMLVFAGVLGTFLYTLGSEK